MINPSLRRNDTDWKEPVWLPTGRIAPNGTATLPGSGRLAWAGKRPTLDADTDDKARVLKLRYVLHVNFVK